MTPGRSCTLVVGGPGLDALADRLVEQVPGWGFVPVSADRPVAATIAALLADPGVELDGVIAALSAPAWSTRLASGGAASREEVSWLAVADAVVVDAAHSVLRPALDRIASLVRSVNRIGPVVALGPEPVEVDQLVGRSAWRGHLRLGPGPRPAPGAPNAWEVHGPPGHLPLLAHQLVSVPGLLRLQGVVDGPDGTAYEVVGTYGTLRAHPTAAVATPGITLVTDGTPAAIAA